jgi:Leucine-rich repeat (LRR) protein
MAASPNTVAEGEAGASLQPAGWFGRAMDGAFGGASSWVRTLTAYLTLITLAVGAFQKVPWSAVMPLWQRIIWVCTLPALVFCFHGIPMLREQLRKTRLTEIAGSLHPGYFQLAPREDETAFARSDGAHKEVLRWIERSSSQVLYLTGLSGSGKSSILAAHVVPELERKETVVISLRGYQDPVKALEIELLKPKVIWQKPDPEPGGVVPLVERACRHLRPRRLVVILDQFEEFVILQQAEKQKEFVQFLVALNTIQSATLTLLLAFRSDYIGLIENLALPSLNQNTNWKEVPPFTESAARNFLQGSGLKVADNLLYDVLREAADTEQTKGFIRPITINLCGLVLSRFATGLPRRFRHGSLIRGFLRETVELREIRDVAPALVPRLITGHVTKRPRSIAELAQETGNTPAVVRGCLRVLGSNDRAIVRPLDAEQQVWEISHDFLVPLLDSIIARWKPPKSRRRREWLLWSMVALGVLIVAGIFWAQHQNKSVEPDESIDWFTVNGNDQDKQSLSGRSEGQGLQISKQDAEKIRGFSKPFGIIFQNASSNLTKIPDLSILNGTKYLIGINFSNSNVRDISAVKDFVGFTVLALNNTRISDISPLKGLTGLNTLSLQNTEIRDLAPLTDLKELSDLELSRTEVSDLTPLANLQKLSNLELHGTGVNDISPLGNLKSLTALDLSATKVKDLSALKNLSSLISLDLRDTGITDISPLQSLKSLTELYLTRTQVHDLTPLKDLKSLKILYLSETQVDDLAPLKNLQNLKELYLTDNKVHDLTPLKDFKNLTKLSLSGTQIEDITPLKDLKNLKILYFQDTQVRDITPLEDLKSLEVLGLEDTKVKDLTPLKDLKSLSILNLWNTQVQDLSPLKNLKRMRDLNIGYTQVLDVSPLMDMENLINLDLRGVKVRDMSPLRHLRNLTVNNWE